MFYAIKYWLSVPGCVNGRYLNFNRPYVSVKGEVLKSEWQSEDGRKWHFLAEQVSYEPSVSAMLANCEDMVLEATVRLKTKIKRGLTGIKYILIHQLGQVKLTLLKHDEIYFFELPFYKLTNLYTQPNCEWIGQCKIRCEESGHYAQINFLSDYKVQGTLYKRSRSGDPIIRFSGLWNATVTSKSSVIFNFQNIPSSKYTKRQKSVRSMDWLESRRLWRHLAKALMEHNPIAIAKARAGLKQRFLELNLDPRYFKEDKNGNYFNTTNFLEIDSL